MKSYKYVHVMFGSSNFNMSIIQLINENLEFNSKDHIFITNHGDIYKQCKKYENVFLDESILNRSMKKLTNYLDSCKYMFFHNHILSIMQMLKLDRRVMNKIIWCVWGHDLYRFKWKNIKNEKGLYKKISRLIKNLTIKVYELGWKYKTKQMYGVGIGFKYDAIEVRKKLGDNIRILTTPYGYRKNRLQIVNTEIDKRDYRDEKKPYKIMIGHSGYEFLNHIEIIDKLEKFKNYNIVISLVLSYGNSNYIEKVEKHARKVFEDKVEIIKHHLIYEEYIKYISNVDICILDYKHQSALGNINLLLYFNKKLFLNKQGIIKTALLLEGIETCNVSDIKKMNFEEFVKPIKKNNNGIDYSRKILNEETHVQMWINTLKELD